MGGVQQGDRSLNGQIYPRMEQERRPTSPPTKTFDIEAQAESTAPESSSQGGRRGTQTRRRVTKDGLVYKRRKMGVKHEMKAWVMVGKSSRLRLVAEAKSKRNNREEIAQRGSLNSLLKGVETMSDEAGKKAVKETNGVEDPLTNHRAKATGLQKVRDSSVRDHGNP